MAAEAATIQRCAACGAAQSGEPHEDGRCEECRAPLQLAPAAWARGPAGWCVRHPDRPISGVCASCGAFTCTECDVSVQGIRLCEGCRTRMQRTLVAPVAWEERRELGVFRGWWRTTAGVISRPLTFFDQLDPRRDMGAAVGYALVGSVLHRLLSSLQRLGVAVWLLVQGGVTAASGGFGSGAPAGSLSGLAGTSPLWMTLGGAGVQLAVAVLAPFATFGLFLVVAMLQHASLRAVGAGGERGTLATLKVACYSLGGTGWMGLLPIIGPLVQLVWWTVLMVQGTAVIHRRSTTRTLVVVLPLALFCGAPLAAAGVAALLAVLGV